ncbi:hypothetical protein [Nitrosococcus watsonii]|uniref:hypothetical protein n=1 Tax=Nitrosococcus watsonii TaxID=473531 RepID=UPI0002D65700|nr:hypothetical protein [Nitrosococcus watsonii]
MNTSTLTQLPQLPEGRFDVFVGFDLGHGETCLVKVPADGNEPPSPLEMGNEKTFPTAIA